MANAVSKYLFILVIMSLELFCSKAFAQLTNSLPENVRQSFAWGVTDNFVLTRDSVELMAKFVLTKKYKFSEIDMNEKIKDLSDANLRQLAIESFLIDYVEVSEEYLNKVGRFSAEFSKYLNSTENSSPIRFKRNGQSFLRWFIHPLRTNTDFLKILGSPPIQHGGFLAQMTESRSLVLMNRISGDFWSIKLSLPAGIGPFVADKALKEDEVRSQFDASEHLLRQRKAGVYEDTQYIHEQEYAGFRMGDFQEGILVRSLNILKNSKNYLVPYSGIYSRGLAHYLSKSISNEQISKLENKWLGEEPGKAAAEIYAKDALIVNSNHSQNSVLLMNSEKMPISYLRRDFDLDLDQNHEKAMNAPRLAADIVATPMISIGMTTGFNEKKFAYDQGRASQFVLSFFKSFTHHYQVLRKQKPIEFNYKNYIVYNRGHFGIKASTFANLNQIYEDQMKQETASMHEYMSRFPQLYMLTTNPKKALTELILRPQQSMGDITDLVKEMAASNHPQLNSAYAEILSEFLNSQTRHRSIVWKALHNSNEMVFWNFCLFAGTMFKSDHEQFMHSLIAEAARTERIGMLNAFFKKLKEKSLKPEMAMQLVDYPVGYENLLRTFAAVTRDPNYMNREMKDFGFKPLLIERAAAKSCDALLRSTGS